MVLNNKEGPTRIMHELEYWVELLGQRFRTRVV